MAPRKFGLFKARSRDYQEQPSTENLLRHTVSNETVASGAPAIPSTSYATPEDLAEMEMAALRIQCEAEVVAEAESTRRHSACSEDAGAGTQRNYKRLQRGSSTDATSTSTLQTDDLDKILSFEEHELENFPTSPCDDGASTSCDANSIQFDDASSIAPSEDMSVHCGAMKKSKKSKLKEEQHLRDLDMWKATDCEVMQNLLSRSGTLDDQIKWEVIATERGLCTLTDTCSCGDCATLKYLADETDGDAGLGVAPVLNAISIGCSAM